MGRFATNPECVCAVLEDGAVLLNLETRLYYSLNDVGLEVWRLLERGVDTSELGGRISSIFDVAAEQAVGAVSSFVAHLEREGLVVPDGGAPATPTPVGAGNATTTNGEGARAFVPPQLIKHEEPLHEVSSSAFDPQLPLAE